MLVLLAFLFLLTPFPTHQASNGERKNSTKAALHTISTLNIKPKTSLSPASKTSNVSQTLFSTTMSPATPSIKKPSKDKPPSSSAIKVVITDGYIQKEPQKDTVNSSKVQKTELSLKPGSPLVMTHHINLVPGSCTGGCEAEMSALKDRLETLEKEMSALKKKCTLCSAVQCPNNCNKNGKCVSGKCVCQAGFTGVDCSKGFNKEIKVSSDSSTVMKETSTLEQFKTNNTIIKGKDKEDQDSGPATVKKLPLNKDSPVNRNVTQSTDKKTSTTLKDFMKVPIGTKQSANETVQTISKKGKLSLSNVTSTENDKKPSEDSVIKLLKGDAFVDQKEEKQANATEEIKGKDKKQHKGNQKKVLEKHLNVTASTKTDKKSIRESVTLSKEVSSEKKSAEKHSNVSTSTEKDKKPKQDIVTLLKEGSTIKNQVQKVSYVTIPAEIGRKPNQGNVTQPKEGSTEKNNLLNVTSIEKDRKLRQSNNLPKDGLSGKRKVDRFLNVTAADNKDKKLQEYDEITANQKATSGTKKVEAHLNVTVSTKQDKKLNQVDVSLLKETSLEKTKVVQHLNLTNSTEKDRKNQSNTLSKEKSSGMTNATTSSEFSKKKLGTGKETKVPKFTQVQKTETVQKHVNITSFTEKDNKPQQGNVTLLKYESSRKTKQDSQLSGTVLIRKENKSNETKILKDVTAEKKVAMGKKLNVTTFIEKDKSFCKTNTTLIKEGTYQRGKIGNVNVRKTSEKGKKFLQGDETTMVTKVLSATEEKMNETASTTSEKDKSLHHNVKEDKSSKTSVNSDLKNITIPKIQVEKTTKLTDVGPIQVHNITATGFVITWKAPQGIFRNFTVTRKEVLSEKSSKDDAEEAEKKQDGDVNADEFMSWNRTSFKVYSGKADGKSAEKFSQILAGSARSYHFRNLRPQRKYLVSLFSSGPHVRSKVHRQFVSTGPEPPTDLLFSNMTETSLMLFWTKPKSTVTGFKVTYSNSANGLTGSMSVDSQLSHVLISKLSAGSRYDISVRSVIEAIESEAATASVVTVPDPPTDLQAVNITDSKALLIWKPAQAKVDHYILTYGSTRLPNVTVTVMLSGTSVAHQLRGLHRSTLYAVKIMSQINSLSSSSVSTTLTTKSGVKLQVVTPTKVTWNSALISWKSTHLTFKSYRLTYQLGEEVKEVILNPTVSQYELTDLEASSQYTIKVDGESEGQYISVVSTAFKTAQVPYPYPAHCSHLQLNGMKKSGEAEIYPLGKDGEAVWVYCDMETDGGGWTVFQRRMDGATDFFRDWKDYSKGFGEMSTEFWLGNDILHTLTSMEPMSLRVDLRVGNHTAFAHYSNFSVGSEVDHYTIYMSGYYGTAGDSMKYHNGCPFSTKDKDPSNNSVQCAKEYMGGWWYKNCYKANLNGVYATFSKDQGVVWIDWKGKDVSLPFTEMKLRPASLSHMIPNSQG